MNDANNRWIELSAHVRDVRPMLEEVIIAWKTFRTSSDKLGLWLTQGEKVIQGSKEDIEVC